MIRIGVISDTHLNGFDQELAEKAAEVFAGVDIILHAGDLTSLLVLDALEAPEVIAVAGNMDGPAVRANLPAKRIVTAGGFKIGLIHGWGSPMGLAGRVAREFSGVDAVVFGHSHRPTNLVKKDILLFNPGSYAKGFLGSGTVGLLELDREIIGRVLQL
ncbi:MAG: metallophosphatase family protein [Proteobacteria bacterium]|nr:metallophosphatase family protein [Pseudomonadota bacterium]MBU1452843.1 metallophosphatase family protein [Pseudomonadota bacterium]MBU2467314.1 metallophosphatase family protein [Pseudomonadota bacterium]MBU2516782.1 metallophosphatase family protein [Pseudomonadota bacterium]